MTSSNVLFCPTKSPKPAVIQWIIYGNTKRPHPIKIFVTSVAWKMTEMIIQFKTVAVIFLPTRLNTQLGSRRQRFLWNSLGSLKQHFTIHNGLHTARKHITSSWQTLQLMVIQNRSLLRDVSRFLRLPSTSFSQVEVFYSCGELRSLTRVKVSIPHVINYSIIS